MNLWIGTSGFQYSEWKGTFYPEDLPAAKMLPFYSQRLPSTEINYTFRRIPSAKTIEEWGTSTPDKFKFSLKAPQKVTHFAKLRNCADTLRYFHQVTSGLGDKLGAVLFQLPPSFQKDAPVLGAFLDEIPDGMHAAFEFRHGSWFDDEVFALLQKRNAALCVADSATLTTPVTATANYGYFRLRREDYTTADVERWSKAVAAQQDKWSDAFIYFKHEESGIGPKLATEMLNQLEGRALPASPK